MTWNRQMRLGTLGLLVMLCCTSAFGKWAAVVGGYSSGALFRPELQERGYKVIHIQESEEIPPALAGSFEPTKYDKLHTYDEKNPDATVALLRELGVEAIFPGTESSVDATDDLQKRMGFAGNEPATSHVRRDKVAMYKATGTPYALIKDFDLAYKTISERGFGWPVITKPRKSAGSEYFRISRHPEELRKNVGNSIGKTDMFGKTVEQLLLQPMFTGREFAVNGVAWNGEAFLTDVWKYNKQTTDIGARIYDYDDLLSAEAQEIKTMLPFLMAKLHQMGIFYGPFHAEIMILEDGTLALIEIAARPMGSMQPLMTKICTGYNQIALTVDAYLDREKFLAKTKDPYKLLKHGRVVELISHHDGVITSVPIANIMNAEALPSYAGHRLGVKPGDTIQRTQDLLVTHPGTVFLAHSDVSTIHRDTQLIRNAEPAGLTVVAPECPSLVASRAAK